jgi:hypothetical protein
MLRDRSRGLSWPRLGTISAALPDLTGRAPEEPFNEGAAQVRRLVQRDRKELLGNAADILDKYKTEFGDGGDGDATASTAPAASSSAAAPVPSALPANPFAPSTSSGASPFGPGAAAASPFGSAGAAASPFGTAPSRPSRLASIEPKGLSPDMGPDPIVAPPKDTRSWLARITLTQVVGSRVAGKPEAVASWDGHSAGAYSTSGRQELMPATH